MDPMLNIHCGFTGEATCSTRHSSSGVEHSIRNRAVVGSIPTCGSVSEPGLALGVPALNCLTAK